MNKNLKNNLILFSILLVLIIFKITKDRSNYTASDEIFEIDKNKISHILNFYVAENNNFRKIF